MPYITIPMPPRYHQMSFEDMLAGVQDLSKYSIPIQTSSTVTRFYQSVAPEVVDKADVSGLIEKLRSFCTVHDDLFHRDRKSLYHTFHIPKRSGGLRQIDQPEEPLMIALRQLKSIFEQHMFALHHTSAFAYVKGRCTIDAVKRHQNNESWWFLKLDFANFFGNTSIEFVLKMLSMLFPFNEVYNSTSGKALLEKALSLCFLNGGLPQGTPISPLLTNLMMIPIDHKLSNALRKFKNHKLIYTRYADDILISCKVDFQPAEIESYINDVLRDFEAPFTIKDEKTRYGSRSGRNWNLGIMLNKDNEMTIGRQKKRHFMAMINNYIRDNLNHIQWPLEDVQVMSGKISYYRQIERTSIDRIIESYNQKYNVNLMQMIKNDISPALKAVA